jgi:signal transduction histidine kinase/CheY-like chemotaxis protein
MVVDLDFAFSFVVDYPGLILMLFFLGIFRPSSRVVSYIIATTLPFSLIFIYISNNESIVIANIDQKIHYKMPYYPNYYYASAISYLTATMAIAYMIACQLERDARAAFTRERELKFSTIEVEEKSHALLEAKDALLAAEEELKTSAERANLEKSKFMAGAVHDLSQPTQAVALLAESARLALARNDFGKAANLIEMTGRAAQMARSSFQAVLEISRLESGLVKPVQSAFAVQDVVTEALAPLRIIAEDKGVKLRVRMPKEDHSIVFSDRTLLARAVANLTSNAIKYSDPNKGERQTVLIGILPLPNRVRIDVIDNGIGIPESKLEEVFKAFVQLHNPEHNREKGMGLGLSIVSAIFALLPEHRLGKRSREGHGTRFSLTIPRYKGTVGMLTEAGVPMGPRVDLSSLFVWHIEDDEITRVATKALLMEHDVLTEQVASFEELERELPFTERRPDLVITDYRLPGNRTADDVIAMFVRRWDEDIPVIVLTGDTAPISAEAPIRDVIVLKKPASPEDIIGAIHRLCLKDAAGLEAAE